MRTGCVYLKIARFWDNKRESSAIQLPRWKRKLCISTLIINKNNKTVFIQFLPIKVYLIRIVLNQLVEREITNYLLSSWIQRHMEGLLKKLFLNNRMWDLLYIENENFWKSSILVLDNPKITSAQLYNKKYIIL